MLYIHIWVKSPDSCVKSPVFSAIGDHSRICFKNPPKKKHIPCRSFSKSRHFLTLIPYLTHIFLHQPHISSISMIFLHESHHPIFFHFSPGGSRTLPHISTPGSSRTRGWGVTRRCRPGRRCRCRSGPTTGNLRGNIWISGTDIWENIEIILEKYGEIKYGHELNILISNIHLLL